MTFDYIIIGAGSAGCVLANRLTASGRHTVLLLEAGPKDHFWTRIPLGYGKLIDDPAANWCYRSHPEESTGLREIPIPRGRVLGGSSAINGLVFVRGQRIDYDTWAERGADGWSFDDVLPVFKRMEDTDIGDSTLRGRDGPLRVRESNDQSPLYEALFAAGEELGMASNADYNGADQEGVVRTQTTIYRGRRMSTNECYLKPARTRKNLTVQTDALAQQLRFDGKRCTGVDFTVNGYVKTASANVEVLLCGGSVNSPQLLELSGVGQPDLLKSHNIDVVHALPGVGENYRDHASPRMKWGITKKRVTYNDRSQGLGMVWEALRYVFTKNGMLNIPSGPLLAFFRSREELTVPDCQLHFVPFQIADLTKRTMSPDPGITVPVYQLRPESTGSIHITSNKSTDHPCIKLNFFSQELDRQTLVDGIRYTRRLLGAKALDELRGPETAPGPDVQSDDEIMDWMRDNSETTFHPVGTCKMGKDKMAVVDPHLKVHGLDGLRVVDASIMPTMVSGNTNAASIMIGEKASEIIMEDQG